MKLPPVPNPERYAGFYVYDFGTHVSVGYTAAEIRMLRESQVYRDGKAYEIYRVTEQGGFELRGVRDDRLAAYEAMCFLRADGAAARRDYDALHLAAERRPAPCVAELQLAKKYAFDPPYVTALLYLAGASTAMANWLGQCGFEGGERVIGGIDIYAAFVAAEGLQLGTCQLVAHPAYHERSYDEVLQTVDQPLQR